MNLWLDHIQIVSSGSLGISNDLISFWKKIIKKKMADGVHYEKMAAHLMIRSLDLIQILGGGALGISDELINFWE